MLHHYGVLKGKAVDRQLASSKSAHFQILLHAAGVQHRIAINVKSQLAPPEVLFYMDENFIHPVTGLLTHSALPVGYTRLDSKPGGLAPDFIRSNLFPVSEMRPVPPYTMMAGDDLNQKLDLYVQQAIKDPAAVIYAFGDKWGPEDNKPDQYFHFNPGNGIHDIHMNQGNSGSFKQDNGVYQDGALMIQLPSRNKWVAMFIAFQVQSFHTDNKTGHPLDDPKTADTVKIIAAMVNPPGNNTGKEFILLLNKSNKPVKLNGWKIADKDKLTDTIQGQTLAPHATATVHLSGQGAKLGNNGGLITLLDQGGQKIHGVSYTRQQAEQEGSLVQF